jgi:ligand-binding SRPBCC domain-containing protein
MKYRHTFRVRASQSDVANFHRAAASLTAITPPLIPIHLHDAPEPLAQGDEMSFTMGLGFFSVRWVARIEDVSPSGFRDRQLAGPFAQWSHRHTFVGLDHDTTEVVDEVTAQLRRHPIGAIAGLLMWLGLPGLFAYRGWKTRRLLEAGDR